MKIPFAVETRSEISQETSKEDLLNWFPVITKSGVDLIPTPGTELWATIGSNPVRGWIKAGDYVYAVIRDSFYRFANDGSYTVRDAGTILTTSGRVSLAYNGDYDGSIADQIFIVDGTDGYIYDISGDTFTIIADADYPNGCDVNIFYGGLFYAGVSGTGRFFWSGLYDGSTWEALDFATAESNHDHLIGFEVTKAGLWMFGTDSIEVWGLTGNSDLPVVRIPGAGDEIGLKAVNSVSKWGNEIRFLGTTKDGNISIYQTQGYQIADASDAWLDYQITELTDFSDATAYSYSMDGRTFYMINFTTDNKTYSSDGTNMWHRRETNEARHIGEHHIFFNNKHLVSDHSTGKIYELKQSHTTDNGTRIRREATSSNIQPGVSKFPIQRVEIRSEVISQPVTGQGSDPIIKLSISKDDKPYGNWKSEKLGKQGEKKRVKWSRLGACRKAVIRLTCDEPVLPVISGMWINESP